MDVFIATFMINLTAVSRMFNDTRCAVQGRLSIVVSVRAHTLHITVCLPSENSKYEIFTFYKYIACAGCGNKKKCPLRLLILS